MKRKGYLYDNICKIKNIESAYKEVCKNTRNERRVFNMKQYKSLYISRVYSTLINKEYKVGSYNKFIIHEPKERLIVSQSIHDKIINHLIARYILYPVILPCLIDTNVASRINMGTKAGLEWEQKFIRKCNIKYKKYYILKCYISKFFASINHDILKEKILKIIKDKDALKIIFDLIDSNDKGLYIGLMANQVLAIYYLNDFDKFVKEKLKIKYYVRYQDDFLLFHESKEYLKYCFEQIKIYLKKEKLELNPKSRIYKNTDNFMFLGRNTKGKYIRYRNVKRKLKARKYLYETEKIDLYSYYSSYNCYKQLLKRDNLITKTRNKRYFLRNIF